MQLGDLSLVGRIRAWRCFAAILLGTALGSTAAPVRADDDEVKVTIVAVVASSRNKKIDPRLVALAPELKKKDSTWTGFRVERIACQSIQIGGRVTVEIMDDYKVVIEVKERDPNTGCVSLRVKPDRMGALTYKCCCGKFFPFLTPHETKDKDCLVVAIMSKSCKKK